jgi:luciferase family oxidoreductase group 1
MQSFPPLSVLDLSPIAEGSSAAVSFDNTLDLARHAERWGYRRFWLAEHHGMPGIASAATAVVISHVAHGTTKIRVGAGGIMLPNHAPLVIAEQFGTLESLFPGRIDLGLGRAPGSDQLTLSALRRNPMVGAEEFPQDVRELLDYFSDSNAGAVRAIPGQGLKIPIWILGSSLFGARLAAAYGLPFAFASHFAPGQMLQALAQYRTHFRPSNEWPRPYVMLGFNIIAAETDAEAKYLASSGQQAFVNLRSGKPSQLKPPVEGYFERLDPQFQHMLREIFTCSAIGSPDTVRAEITEFVRRTAADEIMVSSHIFSHAARLRSYEIAAQVAGLEPALLDNL